MTLYCECMVKYVVPALRILISKQLLKNYDFNQVEAARLLNVTQPSISNYLGRRKGSAKIRRFLNNSIVKEYATNIAKKIFKKRVSLKELGDDICGLCMELRRGGFLVS
ncbi:MAG: transcriptional regulator [Thermoproteota archaeon]